MTVLSKDQHEKMLFGVISGWANYLDMDVNLLRILYVCATLFIGGFPGVILYLIMAAIMPTR